MQQGGAQTDLTGTGVDVEEGGSLVLADQVVGDLVVRGPGVEVAGGDGKEDGGVVDGLQNLRGGGVAGGGRVHPAGGEVVAVHVDGHHLVVHAGRVAAVRRHHAQLKVHTACYKLQLKAHIVRYKLKLTA